MLSLLPHAAKAQGTTAINVGFSYQMNWQSVKDNINYPEYIGATIGFEVPVLPVAGIEAGLWTGQYSQTLGYREYQHARAMLKGFVIAPFIAPTIYVPLGRNAHTVFLRNEFAYAFQHLNRDEYGDGDFTVLKYPKRQFAYKVSVGYRYNFSEHVAGSAAVGYSTFNYLKGSRPNGFKTSTPFAVDIRLHYSF